MIMENRHGRLSQPLQWGRREKAAVAAVLSCVVAALVVLGVYGLTSGSPARRDCVSVTFASTLGAAQLHACGSRARKMCASGANSGIEQQLQAACRRAGFPYG